MEEAGENGTLSICGADSTRRTNGPETSGRQLQKVPSKLVLFPDEGHWISKPQNSVFWYKTAIDWLDSWVKKE